MTNRSKLAARICIPRWSSTALLALLFGTAGAATPLTPGVAPIVLVATPNVALRHVSVIDGTGAPVRADETVVIADGRISLIGPAATTSVPDGMQVRDLPGHSVLPGLVGMHDHFFYTASYSLQHETGAILEPGVVVVEIPYSAPRLYLAAGVITLRTTGSVEPYTDHKIRSRIDAGLMPGPNLDLTAPYLEGTGTPFAQMHELASPEEASRFVTFWADSGMTSLKAYMHITRAELVAAASAAHHRGLKITGHLCSVTWPEAIAAGIDDFEHGPVYTDTEFVTDKKPDACPDSKAQRSAWLAENIDDPRITALIHSLVARHVAVTSTLPVFEASIPGRPAAQQRVLEAMSSTSRESYLTARALLDPEDHGRAQMLRKEMDFERAFVAAGGLLLAGPDPTGNGGVLPGFGDQREVELLVEAGFAPVAAIQIATQNGARFLGREHEIGTLEVGKRADLILIKGDPAAHIEDIENVEMVFKDGVGYDSARLIESVRGQVGIR